VDVEVAAFCSQPDYCIKQLFGLQYQPFVF